MSIKSFLLFIALLIIFNCNFSGQTYPGMGGIIPDNGDSALFACYVSGLIPATIDTVFGLESVKVRITHTWVSDLDVQLVAPNGTHIPLVNSTGDDGDNFWDTRFSNYGATSIIRGIAPFTFTYRPIGDLGMVNNGQNGNAIWKLYILDHYPYADQGTLVSWELKFGNNPSNPQSFYSSNLPLVLINTNGRIIPDDPKILVEMGIIDNGTGNENHLSDPFNDYVGYAGIELRGSSSQMFPKKPYGFETWDSLGNEIEVSILGMPEESDWILNPGYSDKAFLRNVLAYRLANQTGHYASRTKYCELFVNGQYQGVYVMMEKIKRDANRVNIKKLEPEDSAGYQVTGGYILKIDKTTGSGGAGWTSPFPPAVHPNGQTIYFQYEYPKQEDIIPEQMAYIQDFINQFETAMASDDFTDSISGYDKYIDVGSFIDYFLVNELSRNVDGYRLSTFLNKNRNDQGGKLAMGPVWDYDIAWHNANYCEGWNPEGWAYLFGDFCPGDTWQVPFWWSRMMEDSVFRNQLNCRWQELRSNIFDLQNINSYIDSVSYFISEGAEQRNYYQWPILGYYVWPNPYPYPQTYLEEVDVLKEWIGMRVDWLDENMPGQCLNSAINDLYKNNLKLTLSPNPCENHLNVIIESDRNENIGITIYDLQGRLIIQEIAYMLLTGPNKIMIDVSTFSNGLYLIKTAGKFGISKSVFIKK